MLKHIVLFKFKDFSSDEEKRSKLFDIQEGLEGLSGEINELKRIEVGINNNPSESYDLSLYTEFENKAGLDAYAIHPKHVELARIIKLNVVSRACVDYEV